MNKGAIIGLLLFISLAANVLLGSMIAGKKLGIENYGQYVFKMISNRVDLLPEHKQAMVNTIMEKNRSEIDAAVEDIKNTRRELFTYLKSDSYQREEANVRAAEMREKTSRAQEIAQTMVLDMVDILTQEEREIIFKHR